MKQIIKIIIGLLGVAVIGLVTYYVITNETNSKVLERAITNPEQDTVATAQVTQDSILVRIGNALGLDGEKFTSSDVAGVYTNSTKDKILVLKEDIWKKIIKKIQNKFPVIAEDCIREYQIPNVRNYNFIGILTYLADGKNTKTTTAYAATEIRKGYAKSTAGGEICCDCKGDTLVPQQMDAVIVK